MQKSGQRVNVIQIVANRSFKSSSLRCNNLFASGLLNSGLTSGPLAKIGLVGDVKSCLFFPCEPRPIQMEL